MDENVYLNQLSNRRRNSNLLGCGGCASVFVIPYLLLSSGNWGALSLLPLIGLLGLVVAITGWVSAGRRANEIALIQSQTSEVYSPHKAAPVRAPGSSIAPSAQNPQVQGQVQAAAGSGSTEQTSARKASMADRIEKARRAGL